MASSTTSRKSRTRSSTKGEALVIQSTLSSSNGCERKLTPSGRPRRYVDRLTNKQVLKCLKLGFYEDVAHHREGGEELLQKFLQWPKEDQILFFQHLLNMMLWRGWDNHGTLIGQKYARIDSLEAVADLFYKNGLEIGIYT